MARANTVQQHLTGLTVLNAMVPTLNQAPDLLSAPDGAPVRIIQN